MNTLYDEEYVERDQIKVIDGNHDLFDFPLKVKRNDDNTIDICHTHQTFVFDDQMKQLIQFTKGKILKYYYQENLTKGIAICEVGHLCNIEDQSIKPEELKLVFNIICRMYNYHSKWKALKHLFIKMIY